MLTDATNKPFSLLEPPPANGRWAPVDPLPVSQRVSTDRPGVRGLPMPHRLAVTLRHWRRALFGRRPLHPADVIGAVLAGMAGGIWLSEILIGVMS